MSSSKNLKITGKSIVTLLLIICNIQTLNGNPIEISKEQNKDQTNIQVHSTENTLLNIVASDEGKIPRDPNFNDTSSVLQVEKRIGNLDSEKKSTEQSISKNTARNIPIEKNITVIDSNNINEANNPITDTIKNDDQTQNATKTDNQTQNVAKIDNQTTITPKADDQNQNAVKSDNQTQNVANTDIQTQNVTKIDDQTTNVARIDAQTATTLKANDQSPNAAKTDNQTQNVTKIDNQTTMTPKADNQTQNVAKIDNQTTVTLKANYQTTNATKTDIQTQNVTKIDNQTTMHTKADDQTQNNNLKTETTIPEATSESTADEDLTEKSTGKDYDLTSTVDPDVEEIRADQQHLEDNEASSTAKYDLIDEENTKNEEIEEKEPAENVVEPTIAEVKPPTKNYPESQKIRYFEEESESSWGFLSYFLLFSSTCIVAYIAYHNKNKLIGRQMRRYKR